MQTATKKTEVVEVTPELVNGIEVLRFDKKVNPYGFQRQLDARKARRAADTLAGGKAYCPPIILGKVGSKLIVVDGQHRLEAWKQRKFPLQAVINHYDSIEHAAMDFDTINAHGSKVSLRHRLNVSPALYHRKVREIARKYGVEPTKVHYTMVGIIGHDRLYRMKVVRREEWELGEWIISQWIRDPRWALKGQVYSSAGALRIAGGFISKAKDRKVMLGKLQKMEFFRSGALSRVLGSSNSAYQQSRQYVSNWLIRKGLL
jgi:hypothetical protein